MTGFFFSIVDHMDIVNEVKYLLVGLDALLDKNNMNIVICPSMNYMMDKKTLYEKNNKALSSITYPNKTHLKEGGCIKWGNSQILLRGCSPAVVIFFDIDKNSEIYQSVLPLISRGTKIYSFP